VPDDVASINYTYRGHGYPLGAMVTHEQYLRGARVLQEGLQGRRGERMLVVLPMAHIFTLVGCVLVPLLYRMTSAPSPTMHPRRLFDLIGDLRIQHVTAVPEMLEMWNRVHDPAADLSSLQTFVSGGSVLTADSWADIRRRFSIDLLHGYGLTEITPVARNVRGRSRGGTVGPLCEGIQCRIHGAGADGVGEIQLVAASIGNTYYRRPAESAQANQDGWFRTGDLGRLDDGHLVFCRELKRTRKINGSIVDLAEVERAFRRDPDVADVEALWKDNALSARVALNPGVVHEAKAESLRAFLRDLLAAHKIPRQIALF
jgi:long-chain acyl-CoA synthetase